MGTSTYAKIYGTDSIFEVLNLVEAYCADIGVKTEVSFEDHYFDGRVNLASVTVHQPNEMDSLFQVGIFRPWIEGMGDVFVSADLVEEARTLLVAVLAYYGGTLTDNGNRETLDTDIARDESLVMPELSGANGLRRALDGTMPGKAIESFVRSMEDGAIRGQVLEAIADLPARSEVVPTPTGQRPGR